MTYTLTSDQLSDLRRDIGVRENIQLVTLTGAASSGTFTLTYRSATTGTIAYNAAASAVKTALEALTTLGTNNVLVTGSAGGPYKVGFANENADLLTASAAGLTGGSSPAIEVEYISIFTDDELHRNYTRAEGDYDIAVVTTLRQLWASKALFELFTVGQTDESKQAQFDNIGRLLDRWEKTAGLTNGQIKSGIISLGLDMTWTDVESISNS
jgi:hypothetical protein